MESSNGASVAPEFGPLTPRVAHHSRTTPTSFRIYAFRGLRTVHGTPFYELPDAERAPLELAIQRCDEIYSGHVGFSFDEGRSIWGIHLRAIEYNGKMIEAKDGETWAEAMGISQEEVAAMTQQGWNQAGPAIVKNGVELFQMAASGAEFKGWNTEVRSKDLTAEMFARPPHLSPPLRGYISGRLAESQRLLNEMRKGEHGYNTAGRSESRKMASGTKMR